jgi:hypothetical protein
MQNNSIDRMESRDGSTHSTPPAAQLTAAGPSAAAAREAAVQAAEIVTQRSELKRLREENVHLRKMAEEYRKLEQEADYLRGASLMQHEEKVPIRLRQLEQENLRLRKLNTSFEERLKTLESEDYRQRMIDHHRFFHQDFETPAAALSPSPGRGNGGRRNGTDYGNLGGRAESDDIAGAVEASAANGMAGNNGVHIGQKSVVVIKGGTGPCTNCKFRLSVQQRAHEGDMMKMKATIADLEAKLSVAQNELDSIRQWVGHVVQVHNQYPTLANRFPTTSISSPGVANPDFASPRGGFAASPGSYLDAQKRSSKRTVSIDPAVLAAQLPPGTPPRTSLYGGGGTGLYY